MFEYYGSSDPFLIVTHEDGRKSLINFKHIVQIKSREDDKVGCVVYMRDGRSSVVQQSIDSIHIAISGGTNERTTSK